MKAILISCLSLVLIGLPLRAAAQRPAQQSGAARPNVVLIMADDMAWGDVRSHGNSKIDTPVLDRFAADSVRFERFIVSTACTPTRASLLTGRYHLRTGTTGAVTRGLETMRTEEVTIAELLKTSGYATGLFGKWHNGAHYPYTPNAQGFDEFFGYTANALTSHFDTPLVHNGREVKTKGYITDVLTDRALAFIEKNQARPFFAYLAHAAPHAPMQVPDRYFDKYKARGFNDFDAAAYGMVENLDENIGRVLKRLDELNLTQNTVVIFLSDNGPQIARYNGGMKGIKGSVDEGGVRVPAFVRFPQRNLRSGKTVRHIAAHIDLLPTIAELTRTPIPRRLKLDGISLVPLLEEKQFAATQRMIFTHTLGGENSEMLRPSPFPGAVRTDVWRAINKGKGWELYDIVNDPAQNVDVALLHPEAVRKFSQAYETWFKDVTQAGFERLPIPIGYEQSPEVELPAPEAFLAGGVRWIRPQGLNGDWIVNWTSADDRISWELDAVRGGRYEVLLEYACPSKDIGSRIAIEFGGQRLEATINRAHYPPPLKGADRVPRVVPEKIWARMSLGTIQTERGRASFVLRALAIPGGQVAEVKAVHLRRVKGE